VKFRADVEPTEPMRGLEVPEEVVEAMGGGKRPPVPSRSTVILEEQNCHHAWPILIRPQQRQPAGCRCCNRRRDRSGMELDAEPAWWSSQRTSAHALDADPAARAA